jgi:2-polyprenyl-6-methoxyphenol hydroxylase-like FAD-dependent oxidoreductase
VLGVLESSDVVVVGGGIAGASLAYALASAGLGVTVFEASVEYADRVRGETMVPWGVAEARRLGVEQVLLDAGGHVSPVWRRYEGTGSRPFDIPISALVPGIPGTLNMRHPDACQALLDAAVGAGAVLRRGVRDVTLGSGTSVTASYATAAGSSEVRASIVVGADGRGSAVRRQAGITLERQEAVDYIAGILVADLDGVPDDHDSLADGDELLFLAFHQGGGRARLYAVTGVSGRQRFAGPNGGTRLLEAFAIAPVPWADKAAAATPAGPCATYPGDDTWTATPYADRLVLIGDAAGHNDPITGQGLSIAMRDARIVRDIILDGGRDAVDFVPYGEERMERMERLRLMADIASVQIEDADNRQARRAFVREKMANLDPEIFPLQVGLFTGPETVPAELVRPGLLEEIRQT